MTSNELERYKRQVASNNRQKATIDKDTSTFEDSSKKKSTWEAVGSTLGMGAAMLLTGGLINPITAGLIAASTQLIGKAAGSYFAGPVEGGETYAAEAAEMNELDTGEMAATFLKDGMTAGLAQKAQLMTNAKSLATADNLANAANIAEDAAAVGNLKYIDALDIAADATDAEKVAALTDAITLDPSGIQEVYNITDTAGNITDAIDINDLLESEKLRGSLSEVKGYKDFYEANSMFDFSGPNVQLDEFKAGIGTAKDKTIAGFDWTKTKGKAVALGTQSAVNVALDRLKNYGKGT
tara:strand:- start:273 stop:1160 length:888 start_codon:yes stop_codon:yes gene_type:complete